MEAVVATGEQAAPIPPGLTRAEVRAREEAGQVNDAGLRPSRSVGQILRANVCTRFNAILGSLLVVIAFVGPFQDALFGLVLAANTVIGIVQELRAKRLLDRLALLAAPRATVRREGEDLALPVERVVVDDVLRLRTGDQIVVDGLVLGVAGLEVDESLLTGEADPVAKQVGDEVLSGSFVVAGQGWFRATRVGPEAYAARLAHDAREFGLVRSELRAGTDRILRGVTWVMGPIAALLFSSQLVHNEDLADALRGSVAGVASMVPEGLVLLTSIAMAVAVLRLAGRRVLVQELASVETLARVDVVCLDKTGTLTEGAMSLASIEALSAAPAAEVLAALAAVDPSPNASMRAIGEALAPARDWRADAVVPFSSARRWSAASFGRAGSWVLGAPDVLLARHPDRALAAKVTSRAAQGQRVLLLARAPSGLAGEELPDHLEPAALVALEDRLRPEAAGTLDYFTREGVALKILSGDDPRTVGALAARLGLATAPPVDAQRLPSDPRLLGEVLERATVFGRVSPHQKRAMVAALQSRGHVVAMTGDGVNDVLALKAADIGVALASGSGAARTVAQVVLLDNSFDALPHLVAEGRRVIANIERVAKLFLTKTVYASLLAFAVGVARLPFPFLPRHLTVVTALTIGIPAFVLALEPNLTRSRGSFVASSLRFAVPAGVMAAVATFVAYAALRAEGVSLADTRTSATLVLFTVAFWVLLAIARPLDKVRAAVLAAMAGTFAGLLLLEGARSFYGLTVPAMTTWLTSAAVAAVAVVALEAGWQVATRTSGRWRKR